MKEKDSKKVHIEELEKRINELDNNWKRALADYQNLQKRTSEERLTFVEFSNSTLIRKLLPILDNLEMLEKHLDDEGLKMIVKEFKSVIKEEGVEEIDSDGVLFDAAQMEAVEIVDGPANKVTEVLQKGYILKQKLLRPARVKVGNGKNLKEGIKSNE